jgi:hypothetical protein
MTQIVAGMLKVDRRKHPPPANCNALAEILPTQLANFNLAAWTWTLP